jgi:hypothetical protein
MPYSIDILLFRIFVRIKKYESHFEVIIQRMTVTQ